MNKTYATLRFVFTPGAVLIISGMAFAAGCVIGAKSGIAYTYDLVKETLKNDKSESPVQGVQ